MACNCTCPKQVNSVLDVNPKEAGPARQQTHKPTMEHLLRRSLSRSVPHRQAIAKTQRPKSTTINKSPVIARYWGSVCSLLYTSVTQMSGWRHKRLNSQGVKLQRKQSSFPEWHTVMGVEHIYNLCHERGEGMNWNVCEAGGWEGVDSCDRKEVLILFYPAESVNSLQRSQAALN